LKYGSSVLQESGKLPLLFDKACFRLQMNTSPQIQHWCCEKKEDLRHFQENILYFLRETYYSAAKHKCHVFNKYGTLSEHGEKKPFARFLNYKYERNGKDQRTVKT